MEKEVLKQKLNTLGFNLVERDCKLQNYLIQSLIKNIEPDEDIKKQVEIFKNPLSLYGSDVFKIFTNDKVIPNLIKGSKIIRDHIDNNKKLLILTDYDCDGAMSAGTIARLIKEFKGYENYTIRINKRKYGNGINEPFIKDIETTINLEEVDLIVTADHGVGSILYLSDLLRKHKNMTIVVTDHHIPLHETPEDVKDRLIIIDAHISEHDTLAKKLSGATIAGLTFINTIVDITDPGYNLMYCWSLLQSVSDLLAISVISDVMDVSVVFNRLIVKMGLEQMNDETNTLFNTFKNYVSGGFSLTIDDLRFSIIPMINSANRLHKETILEDLLIKSTIVDDFIKHVSDLYNCNKQRKLVTNSIVEMYRDAPKEEKNGNAIVIKLKTNLGVNGLVSGKIGELEQKPAVCFIESEEGDDTLHGSLRSIIGVNLLEILETLKSEGIVENFGGHKEACGCSIKSSNFEKFKKRFAELCPTKPNKELANIDLVLDNTIVDSNLAKKIKELEPYGNGFKEPTLYSEFVVTSSYFNGRTMFIGTMVDDMASDDTIKRKLKLIAFNTGKYDLETVVKDLGHIGCSFSFKSEVIVDGRTPALMIKHISPLRPETEIFTLI